jgi:hypothetical protein
MRNFNCHSIYFGWENREEWQDFVIYEGESKIILNVGTCCAVGYTAGWAWCYSCGLLGFYCCGSDVTLEVHCCHEFCVINLDGPLFICTKEEQRSVICFLWAESLPGPEMHRRITVQYGNSVVSQRMVYEWIERFKNGRTNIKSVEGARSAWLWQRKSRNTL